ncbi:MAG: hypothetical protein Q7J16_00285, partial [Candidatus Cloacimonadales bacterium]|nr:hypothetical protein [Candidatus Cloacimonadales bacterium]
STVQYYIINEIAENKGGRETEQRGCYNNKCTKKTLLPVPLYKWVQIPEAAPDYGMTPFSGQRISGLFPGKSTFYICKKAFHVV